jgi:hypothetical protein
MKRLKDIENHLERAEARYKRFILIEAIREKQKKRKRIVRICVGLFSVLCAFYAILSQF